MRQCLLGGIIKPVFDQHRQLAHHTSEFPGRTARSNRIGLDGPTQIGVSMAGEPGKGLAGRVGDVRIAAAESGQPLPPAINQTGDDVERDT